MGSTFTVWWAGGRAGGPDGQKFGRAGGRAGRVAGGRAEWRAGGRMGRRMATDRTHQTDDALLEKPRVDVVRALTTVRLRPFANHRPTSTGRVREHAGEHVMSREGDQKTSMRPTRTHAHAPSLPPLPPHRQPGQSPHPGLRSHELRRVRRWG